MPDHLAETFGGRTCGGILDLFVGYDNCPLVESSRDMTTFQTLFSVYRLTTLLMGWTNSVPVFHEDITHILQPEIPDMTIPYIDDVPIRGPATDYRLPDGDFERIPENSLIRCFVREQSQPRSDAHAHALLRRYVLREEVHLHRVRILCARLPLYA